MCGRGGEETSSESSESSAGSEKPQGSAGAEKPAGSEKPKLGGRRLRRWIWIAVAGITLAGLLVLAILACRTFEVRGESMRPTLSVGDTLLTERLFAPGRFAVIVCADPVDPRRECVKRVVGLPGETVALRGGTLFVDGQETAEEFATVGATADFGPVRVPEGAYFVLGDNRPGSVDSRVWARQSPPVWLTGKAIRGRVFGRIPAGASWPRGL